MIQARWEAGAVGASLTRAEVVIYLDAGGPTHRRPGRPHVASEYRQNRRQVLANVP